MPLIEHKRFDQANRPIIEFELTGDDTMATTWMKPFIGPAELQIRIKNNFVNGLGLCGTINTDSMGKPSTQYDAMQMRQAEKR
jgi:hypothetical protein